MSFVRNVIALRFPFDDCLWWMIFSAIFIHFVVIYMFSCF